MTKLLVFLCCAPIAFAADPAQTKEQAAAAAIRDLRDAQSAYSSTQVVLAEQKEWIQAVANAAEKACEAIGKRLGAAVFTIAGKQVNGIDCVSVPKPVQSTQETKNQ